MTPALSGSKGKAYCPDMNGTTSITIPDDFIRRVGNLLADVEHGGYSATRQKNKEQMEADQRRIGVMMALESLFGAAEAKAIMADLELARDANKRIMRGPALSDTRFHWEDELIVRYRILECGRSLGGE